MQQPIETSSQSLEQRVANLERQVGDLLAQRQNGHGEKPWLRVAGMFAGDEGMREIFDEALKLREKNRQHARQSEIKRTATRRANK
jgi:hypothetical protein